MRNLHEIDEYRSINWELGAHGMLGDRGNGCFVVPHGSLELNVIASNGGGWDHISISLADRCPTWEEMEFIRKLFTGPNEVWLQFGVPDAKHINHHSYCLHWWRPQHREIRLPPAFMVGPAKAVG